MSQMPAKGNSVLITTMVGLFAIAVARRIVNWKKKKHTQKPNTSSSIGFPWASFFIRECVHLAMVQKEGAMGFLRRI